MSFRPLFARFAAGVLLASGAAGLVAAQPAGEPGELLTLREAVDAALERNYNIRIARNQARIAQNNYTLGNAGFLPRVGFTARQSQSNLLSAGGDQFSQFLGASQFQLDAAASVTLFDGLGRFATYERLETLAELGTLDALQFAEATLAEVLTLYFDVVRQQQQLGVLREAVEISQERLRIAELRRDLGSASELEVRRARVDLNADQAALLRQEVALVNTKAALNQRLGREQGLDFEVIETIDVNPALDADALRAAVLDGNKALAISEGARVAALLEQRTIRAEWWPRVDFAVGYAFNDLTSEIGLPTARPGGFNYGLSASFDLFEGFNRNRRLQNAALQVANAALAIEDTETRLLTALDNDLQSYRNSLALIALEEENLSLAQQNVDVALERFRLGTITSIELREVQTALTSIESRLITARFEAKAAEIDLLLLSGRLLDRAEL